ncbi:hypothetical protein, variant 2 [Aphanomyces astaci]|uniref:Band 7 domain-containing protein n=1 Tax=Aphanomyces astaci TaxID=112090 RepID=W4FJX3_APHAT|nr:hypothetical protein, variant 2 [Aphanomyces astaci]ETV67146.1 hypothetical protein, variant 2 [Aphanomyces astaci]|eukprot:XP_009843310.1 hypothetical protein, variant 2 [Aphanomyces astaci]
MAGMDVLVALAGVLLALISQKPLHRIEEGSVGVYWRGGRLLNMTSAPGYHLQWPILTKHANVQVSFKTSVVLDVPCGTASGVLVRFQQVEIVHRLRPHLVLDTMRNYSLRFEKLWIEDVTYHEINVLCSKYTLHQVYISHFDQLDELLQARMSALLAQWAPGLEIMSIRFTKPDLPAAIRESYELVDEEKIKLLMATQAQRNVVKRAETDLRTAVLASETASSLSIIHMQKLYEQTLATQNISRIQTAFCCWSRCHVIEPRQGHSGRDLLYVYEIYKYRDIDSSIYYYYYYIFLQTKRIWKPKRF